MSRFRGVTKAIHQQSAKTGVILVNLGTPEAPTPKALRKYLKEFLSDPRVVEIPRIIWFIILRLFILPFRPKKSAKLYQEIWTEQGSPIMAISKLQTEKLRAQLNQTHSDSVLVDLAMRYGQPSIKNVLQSMQSQGVNKLVILPMYPQYAGPTTGSVFDAITTELQQWRWVPSLSFIGSYHDHPLYIAALVASIKEHFANVGKPNKLVFSYHGMPKLFLEWGDPYYCMCMKTTRLVIETLGLKDEEYIVSFQSRFGKAEWLQPYTDKTLAELAQSGCSHVAIVSPAFSADCLETLEELEKENREVFMQSGGKEYHYIPALNDRDDHIELLVDLVSEHLTK